MTTLHMDVGVARSTERTLRNTADNINSMLSQASQAVSQLEGGAWQGNAAMEFYGRFGEWKNRVQQLVQELESLSHALGQEISQWETTAGKLG